MTPEALAWARRWVPDRQVTVIDVGGRDINGSARSLFQASSYLSVDLHPGPGVDLVQDFTTYQGDTVDVVVCMETAEHTEAWPQILENAAKHLDHGGLLIFTAAGPGWPPHSAADGGPLHPGEHYENIDPADLQAELERHFARCEVDVDGNAVRAVAWR